MIDLSKHKLELNYPCEWVYKVIGANDEDIQNAVASIMLQREHSLTKANVSKKGKFKSYTLKTLVHNEDDRNFIYEALKAHNAIKMVL